jgi:predicted small lipoprotein YifL
MRHPNLLTLSVLAAVLAGLLLAGCGKKGPLYLPDRPRAPVSPTPQG